MLQLLGEWRAGAAKDSPSVFGIYYGTGIGAAYLVGGNPRVNNAAGLQAGHIPIMAQGKQCICGNTDCVEAYACGHTLLELAKLMNALSIRYFSYLTTSSWIHNLMLSSNIRPILSLQ